MAWKNIPEKKVLATLKDGKDFKGTAAEKMTIYVDGGVPGSEGDVKGISVTVDPSTYIMTTQLKDGKGRDVGSPATIDLPLESMVVGGEYDEKNKSIILTLKNGQTVEFSVADLVSGLQTEITAQNPLSADLVAETANKNFVTSEEKSDIDSIPGLYTDIDDVRQALGGKQDIIDENNPLNADLIDSSSSDDKTYQTGTGAPTTSTAGSVGEMYVDKSTGAVYVCTGVNGGVYTWSEIVAKDRVKTLTTADYNYPTSGTKTSIALWLLPEGVYNIGEALTYKVNVNNTTSTTGKDEYAFIIVNEVGGSTVIEEFTTLGIRRHSTNTSTGAKEGFAQLAFVDDLNTPDTSRGLTAKQGKVLNEKIPVITMTSTDPGEGSALAENHFIAVYEV